MNSEIYSFDPILGMNPRILILGTFPSLKSLEIEEYYAHPRNAFWRIIQDFFASETTLNYNEKKALIENNSLALWDVCATCFRKGSLDSTIQNELPNDIPMLLAQNRSIGQIFFNGQAAEKLFRRQFPEFKDVDFHVLPSTSPANTLSFVQKYSVWQEALSRHLTV